MTKAPREVWVVEVRTHTGLHWRGVDDAQPEASGAVRYVRADILEEVAAKLDEQVVIGEAISRRGNELPNRIAGSRANAFQVAAAIVRAAAASPPSPNTTCSVPDGHRYSPDGRCVWCDAEGPAPARDPWVRVAEAPEVWQDGRELLM